MTDNVTSIDERRAESDRATKFFKYWPLEDLRSRERVIASIEEGGWTEPLEQGTFWAKLVYPEGHDPLLPENNLRMLRAEIARREVLSN